MKMMACIIDENTVLQRCLCPVCEAVHYLLEDGLAYFDYADNGPFVGAYEGWDDALEVICEACDYRVRAAHGSEMVDRMNRLGQVELVEEMARDAFTAAMAKGG